MLNKATFTAIEDHAKAFAGNDPFRHVVIEDFFQAEVADKLLERFPAFQSKNALNEMGKVGRKAVVQDLQAIGPFYARVADYLASADFLEAMSGITRIPKLKYDHQMFGGGTHENLHGQELDPHVDFNVLDETGWHRRLNIIVYLNKYWREEWGGSIELHSDPRNPAQDRVKSFAPVFNRAIIFETNEYSWHGFPQIQLPEEQKDLSRKSLSIYLYTEDRPAEEKAPSHGTFYVPRPLPARITAGYTLESQDVAEIQRLMTKRDQLLKFHQNKDLEDSGRYLALRDQFQEMQQTLKLPLLGFIRQSGSVAGYYPDGSVGPDVRASLQLAGNPKRITLQGYLPEHLPTPMEVTFGVGEEAVTKSIKKSEAFSISVPCVHGSGETIPITIASSRSTSGREAGINEDVREISFVIKELAAE